MDKSSSSLVKGSILSKGVKTMLSTIAILMMLTVGVHAQSSYQGPGTRVGMRYTQDHTYAHGVCGPGAYDSQTGVVGCITSAHVIGFTPLDTSTCNPVNIGTSNPYPSFPFGIRYQDSPSWDMPGWTTFNCVAQNQGAASSDPCVTGQNYEEIDIYNTANICYYGDRSNVSGAVIQAVHPFTLAKSDSSLWNLSNPPGVTNGTLGNVWASVQSGDQIWYWNHPVAANNYGTVNSGGLLDVMIYAGPELQSADGTNCYFDPPSGYTSNIKFWKYYTGTVQTVIPGTPNDSSTPCGQAIADNQIELTELRSAWFQNPIIKGESGSPLYKLDTNACADVVGVVEAVDGSSPNLAYLDPIIRVVNALDNNGLETMSVPRTVMPDGSTSINQTHTWLPYGGLCNSATSSLTSTGIKRVALLDNDGAFPTTGSAEEQERKRGPKLQDVAKIVGTNSKGYKVRVIKMGVKEDWLGRPYWAVGTLGRCGPEIAPADMQAKIRALFSQYTDAPVTFEGSGLVTFEPGPSYYSKDPACGK